MQSQDKVRKRFDGTVNGKLKLQPVYKIVQTSELGSFQDKLGYHCTVQIGNEDFIPNKRGNRKPCITEKEAEMQAVNSASNVLGGRHWTIDKDNKPDTDLIKRNVPNIPGIKKKDGMLSLRNMGSDPMSAIYGCGRYMSNEILATLFKDIIRFIMARKADNQFNPTDLYNFRNRIVFKKGFTGYFSSLNIEGKTFDSVGMC